MSWVILTLGILSLLEPSTAWARGVEIEFLTADLPWAVMDQGYSPPPLEVRVSGVCPLGGVGYTVVAGPLPPGLELSRLGYFSGKPALPGSFEFNVRASNGCAWTARRFTIKVTGAPELRVKPDRIQFEWRAGEEPPPEQVLHVSATWPQLAYQATVSRADWLHAAPEHGFMPREVSPAAEDLVRLRVDGSGLQPGRYSAIVILSAWQARSAPSVAVELTVVAK